MEYNKMRSLVKKGSAVEKNRGVTGHLFTLHQRLYHALNLGNWENKVKWHCSDIEIQRLVLRSMDGFLDNISGQILQNPLVKDSVVDMVRALESILKFKSQSILKLASNVAVKMVTILPSSMLQSHHVLDLIYPLANLLASQQNEVVMSCTTALDVILSKPSFRHERVAWEILKETKAVNYLVLNVKQSCIGDKPIEYFQDNASLLSKILWRWPSFRFSVWNDFEFLNVLDSIKLKSENSVKVVILQLYSTLALCGNGADKLLENGESLLQMMVHCMDSSNTHSVRMESFKLARCLALGKRGCFKMMKICSEYLVKAIIDALRNRRSPSEKFDKKQMSIVEQACRLASITRWAGDHHIYFWKGGVDTVLIDLLLDDYPKIHQKHELSLNVLITNVQRIFNKNLLISLRPYVWDILGGLSANCEESINHELRGNEFQLKTLIICACLSFVDFIGTSQISQNSPTILTEGESSARVILMMVNSPCKYISSLARSILCEILNSTVKFNVECLLDNLNARLTRNNFFVPGDLQILVCLMSLACYCSLPEYRKLIIENQGVKILVAFIKWWLDNPVYLKRANVVPHLGDSLTERTCCSPNSEEWEGEDMFLLYSLRIFVELLCHSSRNNETNFNESQLIQQLENICRGECYSHGSKWYASYILSYFGLWGFPNKLGNRIGKLLGENEFSDLKLELVNQDPVFVHEIILVIRCPSLLPPREYVLNETSSSGSMVANGLDRKAIRAIRLSDQVDHKPLLKLLEYVYSGYLQANDDLTRKLKIFARHCKLETLLQILSKKHPKWGSPVPSFDLSHALGPAGLHLSNLLLEADSKQLLQWKCSNCSGLVPHLHVHKVILESNCDYLRALFRSEMQESQLQTIKVPVSWESLNKLVSWFYSDKLPTPTFDCLWDHLDLEMKCKEVQQYIELCWLAEFWLINGLHEECYNVAISCLNSSRDYLSTKMIQVAANFSQWNLVQVAANFMAPSYHQLRNSGELDTMDDNLVEMVRAASVRLSQERSHHSD